MIPQPLMVPNDLSAIQWIAIGVGFLAVLLAPVFARFYIRRHRLRFTRRNVMVGMLGYACLGIIPPSFALSPSFGLVIGIVLDTLAVVAFAASTILMGRAWIDRHVVPPPHPEPEDVADEPPTQDL